MNVFVTSLPRSGSTLVYNLVKELPVKVGKEHGYMKGQKIIFIYRNLFDSFCSFLKTNNLSIDTVTEDQLNESLGEYMVFIRWFMPYFKNSHPNILYISYDDLMKNPIKVMGRIEKYLNLKYDDKEKTYNKYTIDKVKKIAKKYNTFKQYDKSTHIHGKHIGNNGKPYKPKNAKNMEIVNNRFSKFYEYWGKIDKK